MMDIAAGLLEPLFDFLMESSVNPVAYSIILYLYSIFSTLVLSLPIETGLLFNLGHSPTILVRAAIVGLGMSTASTMIFFVGSRIEARVARLEARWEWANAIMIRSRIFVARTRYAGLFILLTIPLMTSTLPMYLFSLFNKKGVMSMPYFALTCLAGGVARTLIFYGIFHLFGIFLI